MLGFESCHVLEKANCDFEGCRDEWDAVNLLLVIVVDQYLTLESQKLLSRPKQRVMNASYRSGSYWGTDGQECAQQFHWE